MDRQQHAGSRIEAVLSQRRGHADHGAFQHVRGRALDRGVDRRAFGKIAPGGVFVVDARHVAPASEERFHESMFATELFGPGHVVLDTRVSFEIGFHVGSGFLVGNAQLAAQPERADPVDDAEIDSLGLPPHRRVHCAGVDPEHLSGGQGMNVQAFVERLFQHVDSGDMGQEPQLDLGVVQGHQDPSGFGHEGVADFSAVFGPDGNVLQVGVCRRQAAGGRGGHGKGGVHATRARIDLLDQGIGVRALEFVELSPFQHRGRQFMPLGGQ